MNKNATVMAIIIAIALVGFSLWYFTNPQDAYTGKMESINLGTVPTASSALIYVAQDQQFFLANGLNVNIKDYDTGAASLDALLKDDTTLSWAAEFPFVKKVLAKKDISVFVVVDRFDEDYLFGRKDRGINTTADLKGKKIGIPLNTIIEFYLGRFLELHNMTMQDVTVIDVPAQESVDAIVSGRVDGVIVWEPYGSQIRVQMADRIVAFPVQSNQPGYGTIIGRNDWIGGHPEIVSRFLKSLAQAEDYLTHNPAQAKAILRKQLNYDDAITETIWPQHQFSISLDQSFILAMEDEARWMIKNNLTTEKAAPNFLDYIYADGLEAIKPESVNIIRGGKKQ
ncbi:MAG: NrtA/SsuA/CpmA family ABC transporter substrate-binding protein [Candidatus Methanoperedens sp.]|uniref:ABC transporter substrate-binding protein n=1 Tax=Candidatus Methanoperedens sp. BLZ2 TaxID=2035255 RepID=UPI001596917A|nr:NrtA/SsuA/CpmA family ABC transporter substrate-binding protein [Candidatus Methanoperedens sp. BLZ2]MBZ0173729.1 NrtA/SsuA/CpmA family ABC transporter substrate-binding protein [Candidatus Methanoperedens nitroreducens]MCX9079045.1 NrtA/SsuA/CpmA family ABC transporter substrate-binding protein [Candidatus Methanoperedens sp.]